MLLTPEIIFRRVEDITPAYLQSQGITALVLDVDNTLTGDGSQQLDPGVSAWLEAMRAAGVSLTIVSNNTGRRVRPFARRIGLAWVPLACKPLPLGLMVAMVGDQLFTDRLAAGLYGIRCLSVLPRTPRDKSRGVRFKRRLEAPFLRRYYEKGGKTHGSE